MGEIYCFTVHYGKETDKSFYKASLIIFIVANQDLLPIYATTDTKQ